MQNVEMFSLLLEITLKKVLCCKLHLTNMNTNLIPDVTTIYTVCDVCARIMDGVVQDDVCFNQRCPINLPRIVLPTSRISLRARQCERFQFQTLQQKHLDTFGKHIQFTKPHLKNQKNHHHLSSKELASSLPCYSTCTTDERNA
jgi:hypothetical protein